MSEQMPLSAPSNKLPDWQYHAPAPAMFQTATPLYKYNQKKELPVLHSCPPPYFDWRPLGNSKAHHRVPLFPHAVRPWDQVRTTLFVATKCLTSHLHAIPHSTWFLAWRPQCAPAHSECASRGSLLSSTSLPTEILVLSYPLNGLSSYQRFTF